jgi:hypothetical protein
MNKKQQKWIRLIVQIIRKALKTFYKEFLKPHNTNKKKEKPNEITKVSQHPYLEENYQDFSSDRFDRY